MADGKFPDPSNKSFDAVKEAISDPLITAKLNFALSFSKQVTAFLLFYQTDKPVLPFLVDNLFTLIKGILSRFLKKEVMEKVTSIEKLIKINVSDKESQLLYNAVNVGLVTDRRLKKLLSKKSINVKQAMEFRMLAKDSLQKMTAKLYENRPFCMF